MKDTCDVGAIKEGIEALKKQIEKDEPKKECTAASGNISLLVFSSYNMWHLSPNK